MFVLQNLIKNVKIKLCAVSLNTNLTCLIRPDNTIVLVYISDIRVVKVLPWFQNNLKGIEAICFDSTGSRLLLVCLDSSLYLIPALSLINPKRFIDRKWPSFDVSMTPTMTGFELQSTDIPKALIWWQTLDLEHNAIIAYNSGLMIIVDILTGNLIGTTKVENSILSLDLIKDNSLDVISLLITAKGNMQYRLVLERHSNCYNWPKIDDCKTKQTELWLKSMPERSDRSTESSGILPTARARLQSLRHLSVEKIGMLRYKLAESRFKHPLAKIESLHSTIGSKTSLLNAREQTRQSPLNVQSEYLSPHPEPIYGMDNVSISTQYMLHRHMFARLHLTNGLLTIHDMGIDATPIYVHKLLQESYKLVATDNLFFVVNKAHDRLTILSSKLSAVLLEGDMEFNDKSVISQFCFENEVILSIHKQRRISTVNKNKYSTQNTVFAKINIDGCLIVTNKGVYKVLLSKPVLDCFIDMTLNSEFEKCETLATVFSLDLSQCFDTITDILLAMKDVFKAVFMYGMFKCHPLRVVSKLATTGFVYAIKDICKNIFNKAVLMHPPLAPTTLMHLSNIYVMVLMEICMRDSKTEPDELHSFLSVDLFYDQTMVLNIVCKVGLYNTMTFLVAERGAAFPTVDLLCSLLYTYITRQSQKSFNLDRNLMLHISNPELLVCFLCQSQSAQTYFQFIKTNIAVFDQDVLKKLAVQLDPFDLNIRPAMSALYYREYPDFAETHSVVREETLSFCSELLNTYIIILLYLHKSRKKTNSNVLYLPKHTTTSCNTTVISDMFTFNKQTTLSAGFNSVSLIRNNVLYTWGSFGVSSVMAHTLPYYNTTLQDLGVRLFKVSCGKNHTLVLTDNGIYAHGSNKYGQLGFTKLCKVCLYPRVIKALNNEVVEISAGQYHSIALTKMGQIYTWGWGLYGQLGHGDVEDVFFPKRVDFFKDMTVISISGGHAHTAVLTDLGRVYTFGSNAYGQLGIGFGDMKHTVPVVVNLAGPIIDICTNYFHTLALAKDNTLFTWGCSPQLLRLVSQAKKRLMLHNQKANSTDAVVEHENPHNISVIEVEKFAARYENEDFKDGHQDKNANLEEGEYSTNSSNHSKNISEHEDCIVSSNCDDFVSSSDEVPPIPNFKYDDILGNTEMPTFETINETSKGPTVTLSRVITNQPDMTAASNISQTNENSYFCPTKVSLQAVSGMIVKMSVGCFHSFIITDNNTLYSWGYNLDYQLGTGDRKEVCFPTPIKRSPHDSCQSDEYLKATDVSCGNDFTVIVDISGKVLAVGNNNSAQCGKIVQKDTNPYEGRMVLLKCSRRLVRLPYTGKLCCETFTEVQKLPSIEITFSDYTQLICVRDLPSFNYSLTNDSEDHGDLELKHLHTTLQHFGHVVNKLILLEKFMAGHHFDLAGKLLFLKGSHESSFDMYLKAYEQGDKSKYDTLFSLYDFFIDNSPIHCVPILLYEAIFFWIRNGFNTKDLEIYLIENLHKIKDHLRHIIFTKNDEDFEKIRTDKYQNTNTIYCTDNKKHKKNIDILFWNLSPYFLLNMCKNIMNSEQTI